MNFQINFLLNSKLSVVVLLRQNGQELATVGCVPTGNIEKIDYRFIIKFYGRNMFYMCIFNLYYANYYIIQRSIDTGRTENVDLSASILYPTQQQLVMYVYIKYASNDFKFK